MTRKSILIPLIVFAVLAGCSGDPEAAKKKYVEAGDKYRSQGKFKEASIMYRNAIKKDPRYGDAYAKLGDVELERGGVREAVGAYQRAVELLEGKNEEVAGKLADIYLMAYAYGEQKGKPNPRLLEEVKQLSDKLLDKNKQSFHGLRLKGFMNVQQAHYREALEDLTAADKIRPNQRELMFAETQVLLKDNQWEAAEKRAKETIAIAKDYPGPYDLLFFEYLKRDRRPDAEEIMKLKAANNPKVARFQLQLAGFYWATQRRDDAEKILQSLLAQDKQMPTARMGVGDFYARTGQFDKAKKAFDDGTAQGGAQKNLYRLKSAMTEYAIGNRDAALAAVSAVVKEDPKNDEAVQLQASMRLASGNKEMTKSAIDDLAGVVQRNPKNPSVRYNLARAYLSRGEIDAAKVQLEEIVTNISDAFLPAQTALGRVYLLKKDYGKAIQTSDTALRLNNRALEAMVVKANALMLSGNARQARNELDTFLQRLPGNPELRFQLATLDLRDQNFNAALPVLNELHSRAPNDLRVTAALTDCLFAINKPQEGLALMKTEYAKNPKPEVLTMMIQTAVRAKDFALAQKELEALVQKNPKEARFQLQLAEVMRLKGDRKSSLEMLKKAQATDPAAVATNLQLALMLETDGTPSAATPYYENALRVDPENAIILNNLAFRLAEENKDLDLALGYAQKARQRLPTSDDVSDTLGWVYIKKNLPDNAIMIYKDLLLRNPKNSIYLYHLAEALALKGERVKAREALQSALATKPPAPEEAKIKGLLAKLT